MTVIADSAGKVSGKFTIPANIPSGSKSVKFTGAGGSHGEAVFVGQGSLTTQTLRQVTSVTNWYYDPLAQTFTLTRAVQLAGVDLWFTAKETEVRVQIREVSNGVPSRVVLTEAVASPDDIVVSGGGHTRILFPAPVSLSANVEYAVVILCDDATTKVSVAELGKFDKVLQKWVSSQPYSVGVLLSSSNASTWTAHQDRDLSFRLLEAVFDTGVKAVDLGTAAVAEATDIILFALAEIPAAQARVEYEMAMNGTTVTVAEGQPLCLDAPYTGDMTVKARLSGDSTASPVLYPGTQVLSGTVSLTADYCTRSIVATNATKAVLVYDAIIPSGATVTPQIQIDGGDWVSMTADGTTQQGDGVVEYRFRKTLSDNNLVKVKLTLAGTSRNRPMVANIRLMAAL